MTKTKVTIVLVCLVAIGISVWGFVYLVPLLQTAEQLPSPTLQVLPDPTVPVMVRVGYFPVPSKQEIITINLVFDSSVGIEKISENKELRSKMEALVSGILATKPTIEIFSFSDEVRVELLYHLRPLLKDYKTPKLVDVLFGFIIANLERDWRFFYN